MDFPALEVWLKTTIPGIILLGAVGSIVAAFCIWAAARLLLPLVQTSVAATLKRVIMHFAKPAAKQLLSLHFVDGENKVVVFYTFQVMRLVFFLFIATCGVIFFALALSQEEPTLIRGAILLPLILSFLAVWYAFRCIAVALIPLYVDIDSLIAEVKDEVLKEIENENS